MSDRRYIGVFDSGMGGLTVAKSIIETMPHENIIYFGDTAHVPYGTKTVRQITEYALNDVRFLNQFDLKAVVIACNTADSVARKTLQERFDLPIFGVIEPAARRAVKYTKNGRIGIMATTATVRSNAYPATIARYSEDVTVVQKACPLLVPFVENGRTDKDDPLVQMILKEYLQPLIEANVDTIVLGCTHYPLLYDAIDSLTENITIISSSDAAASSLKRGLKELGLTNEDGTGYQKYYVSDDAENFQENARTFLGENMTAEAELAEV